MITLSSLTATVVFWTMGVGLVAYSLAFISKLIRAYYICIILGNSLILLTSPLIIQWDFNITVLTLIMITAQIIGGLEERKRIKEVRELL